MKLIKKTILFLAAVVFVMNVTAQKKSDIVGVAAASKAHCEEESCRKRY